MFGGRRRRRTTLWKPRFTIGGAMIAIGLIAILITALRPLGRMWSSVNPALGQAILRYATLETGLVLGCGVLGLYAVVLLMRMDEKT